SRRGPPAGLRVMKSCNAAQVGCNPLFGPAFAFMSNVECPLRPSLGAAFAAKINAECPLPCAPPQGTGNVSRAPGRRGTAPCLYPSADVLPPVIIICSLCRDERCDKIRQRGSGELPAPFFVEPDHRRGLRRITIIEANHLLRRA